MVGEDQSKNSNTTVLIKLIVHLSLLFLKLFHFQFIICYIFFINLSLKSSINIKHLLNLMNKQNNIFINLNLKHIKSLFLKIYQTILHQIFFGRSQNLHHFHLFEISVHLHPYQILYENRL